MTSQFDNDDNDGNDNNDNLYEGSTAEEQMLVDEALNELIDEGLIYIGHDKGIEYVYITKKGLGYGPTIQEVYDSYQARKKMH